MNLVIEWFRFVEVCLVRKYNSNAFHRAVGCGMLIEWFCFANSHLVRIFEPFSIINSDDVGYQMVPFCRSVPSAHLPLERIPQGGGGVVTEWFSFVYKRLVRNFELISLIPLVIEWF
jgi:hypothetical protein